MPRITLSTVTPIRALRAWENNLVIALDRWNAVSLSTLNRELFDCDCTAVERFEKYLGQWPEFFALGLRDGEDGLEAHQWHDGMGEMLDLLPEHWHLEFVNARDISLLLFGNAYMFSPRGRGYDNEGRHRTNEHRYSIDARTVVRMRLEEQLVAVRARIIVVRREKYDDATRHNLCT